MEIAGRVGGQSHLDSHNLRDFLRIKQEDNQNNLNHSTSAADDGGGGARNSTSGLTLYAVLSDKRGPPLDEPLQRIQSNRTLLDIIREDQISGLGGGRRDARRSWKHLRDKIRLRRRGDDSAVWSSSTVPVPVSDVPLNNNNNNRRRLMMMAGRPSTLFNPDIDSGESTQPGISTATVGRAPSLHMLQRSGSRRFDHASSLPRRGLISEYNHEEEEERSADAVEAAEGDDTTEQPVRMSLMALLAETDRQMGLEGSSYIMVEDEEEAPEEEDGGAAAAAVAGYNNCCVCMVRHKGAAFIPCGHTFCRLCSRELWVQRGNCPLCNNYILEILDIF